MTIIYFHEYALAGSGEGGELVANETYSLVNIKY
jgi:hypothetical protein